jgi:molecular chaperone DnaK
MPQIEVTFDIDANGILSVTAKDKGTNKEQKITIQSNSGLSESEIEQMIKDAEVNAEDDKKQKELIEARNTAESQMHNLRKDMEKHSSDISDEAKAKIEEVLAELQEAIKGEDATAITDLYPKIHEASAPIYEAMNKAAQATTPPTESEAEKKDDIVDAEFTEVKKKDAA